MNVCNHREHYETLCISEYVSKYVNIVLSLPLKLLFLVKILNLYPLQKFKKSGEIAVPCSSVDEESFFWHMTPCQLINRYQGFRAACSVHLQGPRSQQQHRVWATGISLQIPSYRLERTVPSLISHWSGIRQQLHCLFPLYFYLVVTSFSFLSEK